MREKLINSLTGSFYPSLNHTWFDGQGELIESLPSSPHLSLIYSTTWQLYDRDWNYTDLWWSRSTPKVKHNKEFYERYIDDVQQGLIPSEDSIFIEWEYHYMTPKGTHIVDRYGKQEYTQQNKWIYTVRVYSKLYCKCWLNRQSYVEDCNDIRCPVKPVTP
jgi:hypothetical protein